MERINDQELEYKRIALSALAWITYALRPLNLRELQHALALEMDQSHLDEDLLIDRTSIMSFCAGLVNIDTITEGVSLVHYTAKAYFEDHKQHLFPRFDEHIAYASAKYLSLPALRDLSIKSLLRRFPLAAYAAEFLGDHSRSQGEDDLSEECLSSIYKLVSGREERKPLIKVIEHLDLIRAGFFSESSNTPEKLDDQQSRTSSFIESTQQTGNIVEVTGLHLAASMGLIKVAAMFIEKMANVDAVDEAGRTALEVAMDRGFWEAAELLVNHGAQVDLTTELGQALFLSIVARKWTTVAIVIAEKTHGAGVSDPASMLILAAFCKDYNAVKAILGAAQTNPVDESAQSTALFVAVENLCPEMVSLLVSLGVNIDCRDSTGQTPLHRATRNGNKEVMRVLLDNGATVDAITDEALTPWSANVGLLQAGVLDLLIDAGADPNTRGHNGMSVLYNSAASGNIEVVKLMLRSGTDPSIRTIFEWAPLHWASEGGHIEVIKLLLDGGAEVNPVSDQNVTPLDLALKSNQVAAAHVLVQAGGRRAADIAREQASGEDRLLSSLNSLTLRDTSRPLRPFNTSFRATSPDPPSPFTTVKPRKTCFSFDQPFGSKLTFGQFVYPSSPSTVKRDFRNDEIKPYQVSHLLDSPVQQVSIRRSPILITMDKYPLSLDFFERTDVLYDVSRMTHDYQELELRAQPSTLLTGNIKMNRTWSGCWKIHRILDGEAQILFCVSPDWLVSAKSEKTGSRWTNEAGKLVARTGGVCEAIIYFDASLDLPHLDALISCYIAKTWSDTVTKHKGLLEYDAADVLMR